MELGRFLRGSQPRVIRISREGWGDVQIHGPSMYSGGQMKFNSNNVSLNFSGSTETIKKFNIPLKSPIKWLPRMQKKI